MMKIFRKFFRILLVGLFAFMAFGCPTPEYGVPYPDYGVPVQENETIIED